MTPYGIRRFGSPAYVVGLAPPPHPVAFMTDEVANAVTEIWRAAFPDATLLPTIGLPSKGNGVMTLTHTMGGPPMTIDGLVSRSPLANNALYSCEASGTRFLNLYEIMLPDVPGANGKPSTTQRYVAAVARLGIDVAGLHYHWPGGLMSGRFPLALHTQKIGMSPFDFSKRTIQALHEAMA